MFKNLLEEIKLLIKISHSKSLKNRKWLFDKDLNFSILKVYIKEEHLERKLVKHNPSGELYFYEWYEKIDWINGNDPQYITYVPVKNETEAKALSCPEITYYGGGFGKMSRIIDNQYADGTRELRWVRIQ